MLTFDIPINISVNAQTEQEAVEIVTAAMTMVTAGAALERAINSWDFIEFVEGEDE